MQVVDRVDLLKLPDCWLVGGCLFQSAWNVLAGESPGRGIRDYDIFYFDSADLSPESEEAANQRAKALLADLDCDVDVRNQARVHLWYGREFGVEGYPRLGKATDGIDHFLAICCMLGVRKGAGGTMELYAPLGVDDVLARVMRPNPWFSCIPADAYGAKAARWQLLWPDLKVALPATVVK